MRIKGVSLALTNIVNVVYHSEERGILTRNSTKIGNLLRGATCGDSSFLRMTNFENYVLETCFFLFSFPKKKNLCFYEFQNKSQKLNNKNLGVFAAANRAFGYIFCSVSLHKRIPPQSLTHPFSKETII